MSGILTYIDKAFSGFTKTGYIYLDKELHIYVSPNGNDDNPGTEDRPLKTLQHAADTIIEHVHLSNHNAYIHVDAGQYPTLQINNYVTNKGSLFIQGNSITRDDVIIGGKDLDFGVKVYSTPHIVIFENLTAQGVMAFYVTTKSTAKISNCKMYGYHTNNAVLLCERSSELYINNDNEIYAEDPITSNYPIGIYAWNQSSIFIENYTTTNKRTTTINSKGKLHCALTANEKSTIIIAHATLSGNASYNYRIYTESQSHVIAVTDVVFNLSGSDGVNTGGYGILQK